MAETQDDEDDLAERHCHQILLLRVVERVLFEGATIVYVLQTRVQLHCLWDEEHLEGVE